MVDLNQVKAGDTVVLRIGHNLKVKEVSRIDHIAGNEPWTHHLTFSNGGFYTYLPSGRYVRDDVNNSLDIVEIIPKITQELPKTDKQYGYLIDGKVIMTETIDDLLNKLGIKFDKVEVL